MHKNLEKYLEEIGHFLPDEAERGEILDEIRSHVLEKAAQKGEPVTDAAVDEAIAAFGRPQQAAERYLECKPIIAPSYRRFLFRYTSILFALHLGLIAFAVAFARSFVMFPFFFIPRLGVLDAVMYLPMAFLADFGAVALFLVAVTRGGGNVRLPWPKIGSDLKELQERPLRFLAGRMGLLAGAAVALALTGWALSLYLRHGALFFVNLTSKRPLFTPQPGRLLSLIVLVMLGAMTINLLVRLFAGSRRISCWIDAAADAASLVLLGGLIRLPFSQLFAARLPERFQAWLRPSLSATLLVLALVIAGDLAVNLVRLGRGRLVEKKALGARRQER